MNIAGKVRRELEEQFSPEQVEEGLKRLSWIIRVRDRGEDCQTVLNEFGIALSAIDSPLAPCNLIIFKSSYQKRSKEALFNLLGVTHETMVERA